MTLDALLKIPAVVLVVLFLVAFCMTPVFLQQLFRTQSPLLSWICDYEVQFAQFYIHPGRLAVLGPHSLWPILLKSPRTRNRLHNWLWGQFQEPSFYDFETPLHRLALLNCDQSQRLWLWTGAALCQKRILGILDKPTRLQIVDQIGEEGYDFATKRANFLSGIRPEQPARPDLSPTEEISAQGKYCLETVLSGAPEGIRERFSWKFDPQMRWDFRRSVSPQARDQAWAFLYRILTKEACPSVAPCFV